MNLNSVLCLLRPLQLMALSASFIPHTIYNLVSNSDFEPFTSFSSFKYHWFARFWTYFGPLIQQNAGPAVVPLLAHATGTVLEIGPGQGHFLPLYANVPNRSKITKIYAVEPNKSHHPALRANAQKAGIADIFEIVDSTIETLESKAGIKRHSIDTIVTLQVLCSINDQEDLVRELRTYLKPNGGKWIVYEHVRCRGNGGVAFYQSLLNLVWPTFFGGCNLTRDTSTVIERTGGWDMEKSGGGLRQLKTDDPCTPIPTMAGILVSQ